jgi:aromatic-L-amino-acid/L-tryptophan decarboxylase
LMDTGIQLGRRFRALKLWMILRFFGAEGLQARLAEHIRLARLFAEWVDTSDRFIRMAPVPFSVVCFRATLPALSDVDADTLNRRLMDRVNAGGEIFISHTKVRERFTLRLAVGNIRTAERHVRRAWEILNAEVSGLLAGGAQL